MMGDEYQRREAILADIRREPGALETASRLVPDLKRLNPFDALRALSVALVLVTGM